VSNIQNICNFTAHLKLPCIRIIYLEFVDEKILNIHVKLFVKSDIEVLMSVKSSLVFLVYHTASNVIRFQPTGFVKFPKPCSLPRKNVRIPLIMIVPFHFKAG
jgi:hypothetical protein